MEQFVLFGDSLIQHSNYQERGFALNPGLQAEYVRRLDVVNRGYSGYNTDQALCILHKVVPSPACAKIRFFLVFFGANDSCLEGDAGSQHVPLSRYRKNLKAIIDHPAVKAHNPKFIVVTPPPINEYGCEENDQKKGYMVPRRKAWHTKLYADAARAFAQQQGLALVDLWSAFMNQTNYKPGDHSLPGSKDLPEDPAFKILMHDGLHFNGLAYRLFFDELMKTIKTTWPEQAPEKLPFVFPEWNEPGAWGPNQKF